MSAAALLVDLRSRDLRLEVDGDQLRCRFKGRTLDPDLGAVITANKPTLIAALLEEETAIAWRVDAMRAQVPATGPIPFLAAVPGVPSGPNTCLSCGESFTPTGYVQRCRLCTVAAQRALAPVPEVMVHPAPAAAA